MTERGEPKNLVVEDKRAAEIEVVKGRMKSLIRQMMGLIEHPESTAESALMYQILAEELEKIEFTTLTKEEIMQLLEEED